MRPFAFALALLILAGSAGAQSAPAHAASSRIAFAHVVPTPAVAMEAAPGVPPQLIRALASPSTTVRADALHAIATLAYATPGGSDLRPAVPALLGVFRADPDWRLRVMALRSLETTADDAVMDTLRTETGSESRRASHPEVRRLLLAVLVGHYGLDALRGDADVAALARSLPRRSRR